MGSALYWIGCLLCLPGVLLAGVALVGSEEQVDLIGGKIDQHGMYPEPWRTRVLVGLVGAGLLIVGLGLCLAGGRLGA